MLSRGNIKAVERLLFPYGGRTKFTRNIPTKPAKFGIKVFWACHAANMLTLCKDQYIPVSRGRLDCSQAWKLF